MPPFAPQLRVRGAAAPAMVGACAAIVLVLVSGIGPVSPEGSTPDRAAADGPAPNWEAREVTESCDPTEQGLRRLLVAPAECPNAGDSAVLRNGRWSRPSGPKYPRGLPGSAVGSATGREYADGNCSELPMTPGGR
jgi:hypothetical protein